MTATATLDARTLARRLAEAEATIQALLAGQIDAVVDSATRTPLLLSKAQQALRDERDRAQRYLDTPDVILLALDLEGRITLVNRYACVVLGWSHAQLLGRDWFDACLPAEQRAERKDAFHSILSGDLAAVDTVVRTKNGDERLIGWRHTLLRDEAGRVTGTFSAGADITDRARTAEALRIAEEHVQQGEKMEAIGRLAGGVAHDFNNLLTVILGNCELLQLDISPADPRHATLGEVAKAALSAVGLTRQLLAFSRKEIIEPGVFDLNEIVRDMRPMLERLIREDVSVILNLSPDDACVMVDRGQMEQILLNLAVNARDAMPKGGTLTIETSNTELDATNASRIGAKAPGVHVVLKVSDTGNGMTADVQSHLFEPFFTTKDVGQGTGLGLATVDGIVSRSGATISVQSAPGRGTSFTVHFPKVTRQGGPRTVTPSSTAVVGVHAETVLVVEDAAGLRDMTKRLLNRLGYTALIAANADEAMQSFERGTRIDILLTDVVMPGASGPELVTRLIETHPALKVVYMSGHMENDESIVHDGVLNPGIAFLRKPFSSEALGRKLREVLDRVG